MFMVILQKINLFFAIYTTLSGIYVHYFRDILIVIKIACNTSQFSDRYATHLIHGQTFAECHLSHSKVFNRKHDYGFTHNYRP